MRFFRAGTLSLLALAACAQGQAPAGSPPCEGAACEDPIPDVGGERDAEPEPEPEPDAGAQPDPEPTDTPEPDAEPDPEPDVEEMGGVFGDPCDSNDDCIADVCIDTRVEGRICTDFCLDDDQCPEGFYCGTYINVDAVSVCLELDASLCDPCTQDRQCGGASDLCADLIDGSFCGRSCEPPRPDCPEGFDCVIVRDDDDAVVSRQCLPSERLCTDCLDADGDGYGTGGACLGPDCDDGDPERFPGAPEVCDGIDNNCDGNTDETTDLQDDPNNCGDCDRVCAAPNATPLCSDGTCELGPCNEGFVDLNGDPEDGCEFACEPSSDIDRPDPNFIDANCDGIDGDIDGAIFVQQDSGDDLNPGTPAAPMQTIAAALQVARQQGKAVYVGTSRTPYPGSINLLGGVDLYGGFNFDQNLARNTSASTRIEGGTRTVIADGVSLPTVFMGFEVRAADASETGGSSYAVWVRDSDGLQILNNTITSGAGASGLSGSGGNDGATGRPGLSGEEGCEEICFIDSCNPSGGNSGSGPVCLDNRAAGNGGGGGRGGFEAQSGRNGTGGFGAEGGDGGIGGGEGGDGTSGGLGGPGLDGANGPGGDGGQIDSRGLWISNPGSEGGDGSHGSGGGGGGGGGGGVVNCLLHRADGGGGGGGGGSGGCGGTGATGGTGGGGSFGVFLVSSSPRIEGNLIRAGLGGRGGAGGEAGSGGAGGEGAPGGLHEDESGDGGAGAPGGAGGRGGHGGGGSGGPSVGIYRGPGSAPVIGPNDIAVAGPGDGGASVGNPGSEGLTGPIR